IKSIILIIFIIASNRLISEETVSNRYIKLGNQELADSNYSTAKKYFNDYISSNKNSENWEVKYNIAYAMSLVGMTNEKIIHDDLKKIADLANKVILKKNDAKIWNIYVEVYNKIKTSCDSLYIETKDYIEQSHSIFKSLKLQNPDNSEVVLQKRLDSLISLKNIISGLTLISPDNLNVNNMMSFLKIIGDNKITSEYLEKTISAYSVVSKYSQVLEEKGGFIDKLWDLSDELKSDAKNINCFESDYNIIREKWNKFQIDYQEFVFTGYKLVVYDLNPISDYDKIVNYYKSREKELIEIEEKLNSLILKIKDCKKN
ncbi:hypothetical protein KAZ01_00480, partial [Candidatus Gracilibacteria bacterium]|nr:hypothetical protein [Candidatus Gracilibacteria bacterium]